MAKDKQFYIGQKAFIDKAGEVLVLYDPKYGLDFPGGKIQIGETNLDDALHREVNEETGLEIEIGKPFTRWYFRFEKGHKNEGKEVFLLGFRCKYISGEVVLSDEHEDLKWVNRDNYKEVDDGSVYFKALEEYFSGA